METIKDKKETHKIEDNIKNIKTILEEINKRIDYIEYRNTGYYQNDLDSIYYRETGLYER